MWTLGPRRLTASKRQVAPLATIRAACTPPNSDLHLWLLGCHYVCDINYLPPGGCASLRAGPNLCQQCNDDQSEPSSEDLLQGCCEESAQADWVRLGWGSPFATAQPIAQVYRERLSGLSWLITMISWMLPITLSRISQISASLKCQPGGAACFARSTREMSFCTPRFEAGNFNPAVLASSIIKWKCLRCRLKPKTEHKGEFVSAILQYWNTYSLKRELNRSPKIRKVGNSWR